MLKSGCTISECVMSAMNHDESFRFRRESWCEGRWAVRDSNGIIRDASFEGEPVLTLLDDDILAKDWEYDDCNDVLLPLKGCYPSLIANRDGYEYALHVYGGGGRTPYEAKVRWNNFVREIQKGCCDGEEENEV